MQKIPVMLLLAVLALPLAAPAADDVSSTATPASSTAPAFTPTDAATIARVEQYLSGLTSVVADFSQVSAYGSTGTGKFYMKRPGKMRWQYNPPTPILLVSDGTVVTYYDASLDQVSYVGVDDTMAGFLAQKSVTLESDSTHLTHFEDTNGIIRATLIRKSKPDAGNLTLEFSDNPLQIKRMIAVDATGQSTTIQLQNAQFGVALDDKLFKFEDPRGITPRKNRRN